MNTQIIEQARAELMARRVAIDNALNSLDLVRDGTTAVEAVERFADRERPRAGKLEAFEPSPATAKRMVRTLRKLKKQKRGPYKKKGKVTPVEFGRKFEAAGTNAGKGQGSTEVLAHGQHPTGRTAAPAMTRGFQLNPADMGGRRTGMRELIKTIAAEWKRRFNREEMQAELHKRNPKLVEKQLKNTSAQLLGLMEVGFLEREGQGAAAVYWLASMKKGTGQSLPHAGQVVTSSPTEKVAAPAGKDPWAGVTVRRDPDAQG